MKHSPGNHQSTSSNDYMVPVLAGKSKLWLKPTDQMDQWLDSQGYYRKHIARDASSLFRCVSEKVFLSQIHHSLVRKHCIQFVLNQPDIFKQLTTVPVKVYVERLHNQHQGGNTLDMKIISRLYNLDFAMYKEIKKPVEQVTSNGYNNFVVLSLSHEQRHYDSVYSKQHIANAAICQSILYEILYKNVFKLEEVDYAVNKMLHDKSARYQSEMNATFFTTGFQMRLQMRDSYRNVKDLLNCGITPFPYKTAKALDPNIYRNVEYDTWNEQRKGIRYGLLMWNNNELREGTRCIINFKEGNEMIKRHGYIQEISENKGPVDIYVEELGQRMYVPYESLELLPNSENENSTQTDTSVNMVDNLPKKKCIINFKEGNETIKRNGYIQEIQEISENKSVADVYVEELGLRMYVPYESIELFPDTENESSTRTDNQGNVVSNFSKKNVEDTSEHIRDENSDDERRNEYYKPIHVSSTPNATNSSCNVQYVHSTSSTVPTTCYVCITSQSYQSETNNSKSLLPSSSTVTDIPPKHVYNIQYNEGSSVSNQPAPTSISYSMPVYSVIPQDVSVQQSQPPILPNTYPKSATNSTEPADVNNTVRVVYNNNSNNVDSYYGYGTPSLPYFIVSPNYAYPVPYEDQVVSPNSDASRISYPSSTSQQQNDLIYALPLNNKAVDTSLYPPPLMSSLPYATPVPTYTKKIPRNEGDYGNEVAVYRPYKQDIVPFKEPAPYNSSSPNTVSTNVYPYYNNSYPTPTPYYYHTYKCNGPCCAPQPYGENVPSTPVYQVPQMVPLAYPEDLYQPNPQTVCHPMLPATHN